jgi:hypothetical protein
MAQVIVCTPTALIKAAACFGPQCIGPDERESIDVHVRVRELLAAGGTNYTGSGGGIKQLLIDSQAWKVFSEDERRMITLQLDVDNAINKGAVFPTDINSLKKDSRLYVGLGWETRRAVKLFLKCQLNALGAPE